MDVNVGYLDVNVGYLDVNVGSLDVNLGYLDVNVGYLDVNVGYLDVIMEITTISFSRMSKRVNCKYEFFMVLLINSNTNVMETLNNTNHDIMTPQLSIYSYYK